MNRAYWWLADKISLALESSEREAVCGDLIEGNATGGQAFLGLLGLAARRQVALWKDWRPWVILIGLVAPLGVLLSFVAWSVTSESAMYAWYYISNWEPAYFEIVGFRQDLISNCLGVLLDCISLGCWSWTIGLVLSSIFRRTTWVQGTLF